MTRRARTVPTAAYLAALREQQARRVPILWEPEPTRAERIADAATTLVLAGLAFGGLYVLLVLAFGA